MSLPTFEFPTESIKLNTLYENEEILQEIEQSSSQTEVPEKIKKVYGDLKLTSSSGRA